MVWGFVQSLTTSSQCPRVVFFQDRILFLSLVLGKAALASERPFRLERSGCCPCSVFLGVLDVELDLPLAIATKPSTVSTSALDTG